MWLLIGGDSEIGSLAYQSLKARGVTAAATTRRKTHVTADRPFLDLSAPLENWEPPSGTSAACIFAAIARIEACEADPRASAHVNVTQTLALADRLLSRNPGVISLDQSRLRWNRTERCCRRSAQSRYRVRPAEIARGGRIFFAHGAGNAGCDFASGQDCLARYAIASRLEREACGWSADPRL